MTIFLAAAATGTAVMAPVKAPYAQAQAAAAVTAAPPATFTQLCTRCHGVLGEGGASGPKITGPTWRHSDDAKSMAASIRRGFPETGMPPFAKEALSDAQVNVIVTYLRAQAPPTQGLPSRAAVLHSTPPQIPTGVVHTAVESFRVQLVATVDEPYGMAFLPDGRILVTEGARGTLRIIENGQLLAKPVNGTPMGPEPRDFFQRRLLDVAMHPTNGWIYLTSSEGANGEGGDRGRLTLSRGHVRDGRWADAQVLLQVPTQEGSGGRIVFDKEGRVYIGTVHAPSDPSSPPGISTPQNLGSPHGKILRLMEDGRVPSDNPFVGRKDAFPYVWAYGLRSPLGLAFDSEGRLWESENGPRGGDELNLIRRGGNYGWPIITWGHPYDETPTVSRVDQAGMEQPVVSWVPSPAVSGTVFYIGNAFPHWKNSLFVCSLKQKTLYRITFEGDRASLQETMLVNLDRMRDVDVGPDGYIYLLNDGGSLLRLVPAT
jgi:glucose/arabinose dehydrogenase